MTDKKVKVIEGHRHLFYSPRLFSPEQTLEKSSGFYEEMNLRRSVRSFSDRPVPRQVIENFIAAASTAPSGAHKQPWMFCAISSPDIKKCIRQAAEQEEYQGYHGRMSNHWLKDLQPLGTDWQKPFLEIAPWLIVVFKKVYDVEEESGEKNTNYYVNESVGIACGMLITAIHLAGLVTLTHTPSPMNFLSKILHRPENERPFLLLPVGYAADEVYVPDLQRKPLSDISEFY